MNGMTSFEVLESKDRDEKMAELEEYYSKEHKPIVDEGDVQKVRTIHRVTYDETL